MTSKKVYFLLLGVLGLVILASIFGTLYGTDMLKKSGDKLTEKKSELAVLKKDEEELIKAKRDIDKYKDLDLVAQAIVPKEKDQARTVRELYAIATQSKVQIESIQFPSSELGQSSSKGKKKSTVPEGVTQLSEIKGMKGVFAMPIDIKLSETAPITYPQLLDFLQRLEQNRRTSHVTSISIQPDKDNRDLIHLTLRINAYIKP